MEPTDPNSVAHEGAHGGKVGFFWIVPDRFGHDAILGDGIELANAEAYGEALTHPGGHYEFWEAMKARGSAWLRARSLSGMLLSTEYEDWPRGRVSFFPKRNQFLLLADRRIVTPSRLATVRTMFELDELHLDIKGDSHYRPVPRDVSAMR